MPSLFPSPPGICTLHAFYALLQGKSALQRVKAAVKLSSCLVRTPFPPNADAGRYQRFLPVVHIYRQLPCMPPPLLHYREPPSPRI